MDTFASLDDLELRWRTLTPAERKSAQARLEDATAFIAGRLAKRGVKVYPSDEVQSRNLRWVTCNVAMRTLKPVFDGDAGNPYTQKTVTAGVFSQTYMYTNPSGDLYLTRDERSMLGLSGGRYGTVAARSALDGGGNADG